MIGSEWISSYYTDSLIWNAYESEKKTTALYLFVIMLEISPTNNTRICVMSTSVRFAVGGMRQYPRAVHAFKAPVSLEMCTCSPYPQWNKCGGLRRGCATSTYVAQDNESTLKSLK